MKLDEKIDKLLKFAKEKFDLHTEVIIDYSYVFGFDYFNGDIKMSHYPLITLYSREIMNNKYVIENGLLFLPICPKNGYAVTANMMYPNFFLKYKEDSILFCINKNSLKIAALRNVDIKTKLSFYNKDKVINITKKQFDDCIDFIKELNNFRNRNILVNRYKIKIRNYRDMDLVIDKLIIPKNISGIFSNENSVFLEIYYDKNKTTGCVLELECTDELFETVRDQVNLLYII